MFVCDPNFKIDDPSKWLEFDAYKAISVAKALYINGELWKHPSLLVRCNVAYSGIHMNDAKYSFK